MPVILEEESLCHALPALAWQGAWSLSFAHAAEGLSPLVPRALGLGSVCKLKMCNLAEALATWALTLKV